MILVLLLWIGIFIIFSVLGISAVKGLNKILVLKSNFTCTIDEFFFTGFVTLSCISGIVSIFSPVGNILFFIVLLLTAVLLFINFKEILVTVREIPKRINLLSKTELLFLVFLLIFILMSVVQKISMPDTESYHAQTIQWVRKYAVVPGLGNIHGRLAFNSMFHVISGLFSLRIRDILIFPLNGICYLVIAFKLFFLYKNQNVTGTKWQSVFYMLVLLASLLLMLPNLNSPSADVICPILIIYTFILIMKYSGDEGRRSDLEFILISSIIFTCITFKLSSLFLVAAALILFNRDINKIWIFITVGLVILLPFLARNYYLSGYLIYPFPGIDLFNVDWKIPYDDVLSMKLEIESWAKISTLPASEVVSMKINEWIIPWFHSLNFMHKMLITASSFSFISIIFMLLKKEVFLIKIQLILIVNLIFWFLKAPDPRFAYGFLFLGFSINIAYVIKQFEYSGIFKFLRIALACFLFLVICRRIMQPLDTLRSTSRWILPASFGTVATNEYFAGFHYRVPVPEGGCYNVEIPCVPYPLSNIELRGKEIQEGFKVVRKDP